MNAEIEEMLTQICEDEEKELTELFVMPEDNEKYICEAEKILGMQFPTEYRQYLLEYGEGGMGCFYFFGVSPETDVDKQTIVSMTLEYREKGMPNNLAVLYHSGDYLHCIDCANGKVVNWSWLDGGAIYVDSNSFDEYFKMILEDYI